MEIEGSASGSGKGNDRLPAITEKMEYDAAIGGNCRLDHEITTFQHCHQRLNEIKALTAAITSPNNTKLVFQKLPKHMRRRAMSHNPNRLPRKYRMAHRAQMSKSGAPAKTKRPSRKYRRKPCNLLLEYQRRQRKHVWLETHIWHAKRFHMVSKWGYKLAQSSCDKTFRSSYRATTKHCLVQDISYVGCIEIAGPIDVLRMGFERMRGTGLGLGICAKAYIDGRREGSIELFAIDSYPFGALGRIQFIWKRPTATDAQPLLWLFAHPSVYQKLINEFSTLFNLQECDTKSKYKIHRNADTNVEVHEVKGQLNRFRLTGPLSHAVLSAAFKPKIQVDCDERSWFVDYLSNDNNKLIHETQSNHWNKLKHLKSAGELPPGIVLALNIEDPRINRPKKRTKALPSTDNEEQFDENDNDICCTIPNFNADSAIWDRGQRERIQNEKVTTHEICVQRNKNILVPGERCAFEKKLQAVPVLVIQRAGSTDPKRLGYGSGYDVIVPPGYGTSTWMCLIMWGAKAGALRETETIAREALSDQFAPDTETAAINANLTADELRNQYFRKPPNKRQNYLKSSIASPFKCPWSQLIGEWCTNVDADAALNLATTQFYVLRNKTQLHKIDQFLNGKSKLWPAQIDANCLIPVALTMNDRGNANKFAIICLPTKQDLKRAHSNCKQFIYGPPLTEPIANDPNELERKRLRVAHLTMLKRLRRRRVRVKRKKQEYSERRVLIARPQTAQLIRDQYDRMCELWLPMSPKTVRHQCTREVFGYLTQCQFMFHEAKVAGIGYVTVNGIHELAKLHGATAGRKSNHVLVRDSTSLNYRLATISVRCN